MRIVYFLALILLIISLSSCENDIIRSSGEVPDYEILVSYGVYETNLDYYIYVISSKYDSVLEEIPSDNIGECLAFSPAGDILYHSCYNKEEIWATKWPEGDTIALQSGFKGKELALIDDKNWLMVRDYGPVAIFNASTLDVVLQLEKGALNNTLSPDRSKILFHSNISAELYYYDLTYSPPSYHQKILYDENNNILAVRNLCARCNCDSIFAIVIANQTDCRLAIIDPEDLVVIKTIDIPDHGYYWDGDFVVHPDLKRLYFSNRGNYVTFDNPNDIDPGAIYEYDLVRGRVTTLIDEDIFKGPVSCYDLEFSPDYRFLYAGVWSNLIRIDINRPRPDFVVEGDVCCPVSITINSNYRKE